MSRRLRMIVAGAIASAATAAGGGERIDTRLRNVMWQALPMEVWAVFVGPDERVWHQLAHPPRPPDVKAVRRTIEREFHQQAPQLHGARVALFEPGRRVWFVTYYGRDVLLGYDGRRWIQRKLPKGRRFVGTCPGHGRVHDHAENLLLAGRAFFTDNQGVHCFYRGKWSYRKLAHQPMDYQRSIALLPEPDGRGFLALVRGINAGLWRWREGEWTRIRLPKTGSGEVLVGHSPGWHRGGGTHVRKPSPSGATGAAVHGAAPLGEGVWLFGEKGRAWFQPYGEARPGPSRFDELLKHLGDDRYKVREKATEEIIQLGPGVIPLAAAAAAKTKDPEVEVRLELVLRKLRASAGQPPGGEPVAFGPYLLTGAKLAYYGLGGRALVGAEQITDNDGRSTGAGMVVADAKGSFRLLPRGELGGRRWKTGHGRDGGPLPAKKPGRLWLPSSYGGWTARLLDVETGKFLDRIPDGKFGWLHAVKADGTVFAAREESGQHRSRPIMAYRPGAPDDRRFIRSLRMETVPSVPFCVADDGNVWGCNAAGAVVRFDGRHWVPVKGLPRGKPEYFIPGARSAVLIKLGKTFALVTHKGIFTARDLRRLLADHRRDVPSWFPPQRQSGYWHRWTQIATDRSGNIWLMVNRKLHVLIGPTWVDATAALKRAGSRASEVEFLCPVGDGSRLYMTDFMPVHDRGSSFYGQVRDGRLAFAPAPHTSQSDQTCATVREPGGALWLPAARPRARRLTEKGVTAEVKSAGWARLMDKGGNLWLSARFEKLGRFSIWRGGKIVSSVRIPSADYLTRLFSDRAGSVWALTPIGLYHLTAKPPEVPANFAVEAVYTPVGIRTPRRVEYSRFGFLVVATGADAKTGKHYLHLLPLPG